MEVDASTEQQPAKPDEGPGIPADTTARDDAPGPAVAAAPAAGGEAVPEGGDAKPASAPLPPAAPPPPPPGPVSLPLFEKWGCKGAPDVDEILTFDEILRGAAGEVEARAAAAWAAAQGGEGASLAAVAPHPPGPIVYTSIDYDMLVGQRRRRRAPGEKGGTTPRRKRGAAADKAKANLRSREQLEKKKKQGRGRAARLKMRQTRLESDGGAPLQTGAKGRRGRPPKAAGGLPPPPLPLPDAAHVIWDMARRPADYADNGLLRGAYNCAQLRDMAVLLRRLAAGQPPIAAPGSAAAATPAKTGQTLL